MSCGLPCVVTRISGTTDIITHNLSGMLFTVNDEASFIDAITPLLRDRGQRKRMGDIATEEIQKRLSSEKSAERYLRLYQSMLEAT